MKDDKEPQGTNPLVRNLAIWLGILLAIVLFVSMFEGQKNASSGENIAYSEFLQRVEDGSVREADIGNGQITGRYANGQQYKTFAPSDPTLVQRLSQKGVVFQNEDMLSLKIILHSLPHSHGRRRARTFYQQR